MKRGSIGGKTVARGPAAACYHLDPLVHTVALASLDEEQLRFPGKTWTAVCSKRLPHLVCWVRSIIAVENALVAMTEHDHGDHSSIGVICVRGVLKNQLDVLARQVLVHLHLKSKTMESVDDESAVDAAALPINNDHVDNK